MKYFNAIIIDDEQNIREALLLLLAQFCPEVQVCGMASSAQEGRELLKANRVEFIFLDISMPREDGFTFLQSIEKEKYGIIFVTAYQEFALKALKTNAIDYLLKPVNALELREAVTKATAYYELRLARSDARNTYSESLLNLEAQILNKNKYVEKITIPEQFGFRIVSVKEIMYLQADSNYTIIHFSSLNKLVTTRSLGDFEKMLDDPVFFRIHKSTIINLSFLRGFSSFQGNFAELTDGTRLSISRRKLSEFKEAVNQVSHIIE